MLKFFAKEKLIFRLGLRDHPIGLEKVSGNSRLMVAGKTVPIVIGSYIQASDGDPLV